MGLNVTKEMPAAENTLITSYPHSPHRAYGRNWSRLPLGMAIGRFWLPMHSEAEGRALRSHGDIGALEGSWPQESNEKPKVILFGLGSRPAPRQPKA